MTDAEFETFWQHYPHRIAKGAARLAFVRALRKTTLDVILAALESYKKHKPEDRAWCHASTWLNQERWEDEWETPATIKAAPVVRPARSVQEVVEFYKAAGKPVSAEIANAKSVDDLPIFARMVPTNVTPLRKVSA